ncbi:uncharacterized protein LOC132174100 [Corylus avellana]|uniref:uncharacterized protein LOC132174100 n=1 Tax=Corylus avellana TaxID=13451 RepID=UPI00286D3CAC|nr:uncharacterized protein LOC132174100 [Corylus avellana]
MAISRLKEKISFHRNDICTVIISLLLFAMAASFLYKYVTENSPESRKPMVIHMNSFTVSNFNITDSVLEAEWEANLTFENRDDCFEISINPFETYLYHKEILLSCTSVESIRLNHRRQKKVLIKAKQSGCRGVKPKLEEPFLSEIRKEKENDGVLLNLEMNMEFEESKDGVDKWDLSLTPSCSYIKVSFLGATHGKYMGDVMNCPINW